MLQPKVAGAWLLHQHSGHFPLDFFILFSSIASAWGSREQAHYSAANRFLDALAHHRRGPAGAERELGAVGGWRHDVPRGGSALLRRVGIRSLAADRALDVLNRLPDVPRSRSSISTCAVPGHERGPRPLLDRVRVAKSAPGAPSMPALSDASPRERKRLLADSIDRAVARVLGYDAGTLDRDLGFFEMGMDSLMALDVRTQLETALGIPLSVALLFDHPTVNALADFLAGVRHGGGHACGTGAGRAAAATDRARH